MNVLADVAKSASPLALLLAFALACAPAAAQSTSSQRRAMTLAYQLTHIDKGEPFFSPDGKRVVFETTIAGFQQIFTMNRDGSSQTQITNDAVTHDSPSWSPDGRKIAFVSVKNSHSAIYVMNADGSDQQLVSDGLHDYIHPNWSADSSRLIYCSDDDLQPPRKNESEIYVLDLKSRQSTKLISGGTNTYPSWSPDGTKIVFRRMLGEMNSEVFVANADGSDQKNLTSNAAFDGWPSWSPDGTRIVFASNRNANYQIFTMNADGTDVKLVANTEGRATEPRWSPDGKSIYFTNCWKVDWGVDCEVFAAELQPPVPAHP